MMWSKNKKKKGQKSFYFIDYTDDDFSYKCNKSYVRISLNRSIFIFFIFLSVAFIFSVKIFYLGISSKNIFISKKQNNFFIKSRADIVDRHNILIARNVDIFSAGIRPTLVKDKLNVHLGKSIGNNSIIL